MYILQEIVFFNAPRVHLIDCFIILFEEYTYIYLVFPQDLTIANLRTIANLKHTVPRRCYGVEVMKNYFRTIVEVR